MNLDVNQIQLNAFRIAVSIHLFHRTRIWTISIERENTLIPLRILNCCAPIGGDIIAIHKESPTTLARDFALIQSKSLFRNLVEQKALSVLISQTLH